MDVSSLYTNIPIEEGLRSIAKYMNPHEKIGRLQPSSIIQLLKFVLTMNNFVFNKRYFCQMGGTAMGTKVAPTFANLFMGMLEKELLDKTEDKPLVYLRYIDDIFMIYQHGKEKLLKFIEFCNQYHRTIKSVSYTHLTLPTKA